MKFKAFTSIIFVEATFFFNIQSFSKNNVTCVAFHTLSNKHQRCLLSARMALFPLSLSSETLSLFSVRSYSQRCLWGIIDFQGQQPSAWWALWKNMYCMKMVEQRTWTWPAKASASLPLSYFRPLLLLSDWRNAIIHTNEARWQYALSILMWQFYCPTAIYSGK